MRTAGSLRHAEQNVATAAVSASRSLALFSYMTIVTARRWVEGREGESFELRRAATSLERESLSSGRVRTGRAFWRLVEGVERTRLVTPLQRAGFEAS